jgi:AraC-like DNA-binding protein
VIAASFDYPGGSVIDPHQHAVHQLVHAVRGVMNVRTTHGTWVVPPHRALWVPAGVEHQIRTIGAVAMRTLYLRRKDVVEVLEGRDCTVVSVSPLLRELIICLIATQLGETRLRREAHIVALILEEIRSLQAQPLHIPLPTAPRLRSICEAMQSEPGSTETITQWGSRFGVSAKTLARDFRADLGVTFGHWRRQVRLLAALERLALGEPITAVALELGYSSTSSFTAMFRNTLGNTPGKYFIAESSADS